MRSVRAMALIPVAALLVAACGDDSAATDASTADTAVTVATTTSVAAQTTLVVIETVPGTEAPQVTTPETAIDGPVQIDVVVGVDSSPDRVVPVQLGADVTLNITNPNAADEFHIHGIELEQEADAGQMITFNFVADQPGSFEVESHVTDGVLVTITVS